MGRPGAVAPWRAPPPLTGWLLLAAVAPSRALWGEDGAARGAVAGPAAAAAAAGAHDLHSAQGDGAARPRPALRLQAWQHRRHGPVGSGMEGPVTWERALPGLVMALMAGLSTVLGALVVFLMPSGGPPPRAMAFALSLAAGVMVSISVEMLFPHFLHEDDRGHGHDHEHDHEGSHGAWWLRPALFFGGALVTLLLCKFGDAAVVAYIRRSSPEGDVDAPVDATGPEQAAAPKDGRPEAHKWRLAVLLFASLTLHNFPEGLAVAVSALSGVRLGAAVCIAIAFHNIPEGIAIAVSTYDATGSRARAVLVSLASGLSEPLGALCAVALLQQGGATPALLDGLMTAVAGVMCYIALAELLPEAVETRCWASICLGFLSGVVVMVLTHYILDMAFERHAL